MYGRTAELDDLAPLLSRRSGLSELDVEMVLRELAGVVASQVRGGSPVHLPGLGRVRAAMTRSGRLRVHIKPEGTLVRAINAAGYRGDVANRGRIGLDDVGYKALWDAGHPGDPMELPVRRGATVELGAKVETSAGAGVESDATAVDVSCDVREERTA